MKPEEKELLRLAILQVMDSNRTRFGLGEVALAHQIMAFGFNAGRCGGPEVFKTEIAEAIEYLTNKQLVEEALKVVSRENRAWRITRAGIAFVDERS